MDRKRNFFRRPEEHDDFQPGQIVKAKPIAEHLARRLGIAGGRDFVQASAQSQKDFYGQQQLLGKPDEEEDDSNDDSAPVLSPEERNHLNAKLLKAEMKGDQVMVKQLKAQLSGSMVKEKKNTVMLMRTDKRTGMTVPVDDWTRPSSSGESGRKLTVDEKLRGNNDIHQMLKEEKRTTAEDQIGMFSRAAMSTAKCKTDDDWVVDDVMMSHRRKRKHEEQEKRGHRTRTIQEHKKREQTLDSCTRCIDSDHLLKHLIVAVGLKTYLAIPWRGTLVEGHSCIVPAMHSASCLHLDEDVYDEMKLWRKGLVAMHSARGDDCVFVETARNVKHQPHTMVECIPMPKEVGETAPIYFKKAIDESETEWTDNKKLIPLRGTELRKAIPKGFSYMAIDFGLQPGYAHVIEDEERFPANFAHEIIGGMLDLSPNKWRKPVKRAVEEEKAEAVRLREMWNDFDWTERVKSSLRNQKREGEDE